MTNENKNKRFYWIKLKDTFFTSDTVDFLMSQKDGANYIVLYQMLCLKTVNTEGIMARQLGEMLIPFDVEKIQRDCKYFTADTIRVALELYKKLGLIFIMDNGVMKINNFENMVGSTTQGALEKQRQKQAKINNNKQAVMITSEQVLLPNGETRFLDEKRYGGNGLKALNNANCKCECCGSTNNLVIHHANGYSNNEEDLVVLCTACHGLAHSKDGAEIVRDRIRDRKVLSRDKDIKILDIEEKKYIKEKKETFDSIIRNYTINEYLITALKDFKEMRMAMKKPLTNRATKMILNELDKLYPNEDNKKIQCLEQSTLHSWQSVYKIVDSNSSNKFNKKDTTDFNVSDKHYTEEELSQSLSSLDDLEDLVGGNDD